MQLTPLSKKLIVIIAAVTFSLVALAGLIPQDDALSDEAALLSTSSQTDEELQREQQELAMIRSLTNFSHDLDEELWAQGELRYTGYIQGAGSAIFRFHADGGKQLVATLADEQSQLFEMLLFSNLTSHVMTISSGEAFNISEHGLYELRLVFRSHIESLQALEAENYQAIPQQFTISLELK